MINSKTCTICNQTKDIKLFRPDAARADGYRAQCRECINLRKVTIYNKTYKAKFKRIHGMGNNRYYKLKQTESEAIAKGLTAIQLDEVKGIIKSIKRDISKIKATKKKQISLIDKENRIMVSAYKKFCNVCSTEKYTEEFFKGQCRCKECDKAKSRAYENNNADKIRVQKAEAHQRRMKDPEKRLDTLARYSEARHKRRANKKTNTINSATSKQIRELIKKSNGKCYWCGCSTKSKGHHIDHYTPLSKGGSNEIHNLVVACAFCNISKGAKSPYVFANKIGRLL